VELGRLPLPVSCRPRTAAAGGRPQAGLEVEEKVLTNSIDAAACSSKIHEMWGVYPREVAADVRRVGA